MPERDRALWLANVVRAGFADWSLRALSNERKRRLAAERLREPRRAYVSMQRLTFQTKADRIAALRDAATDTLKVYPDAAVVGVRVGMLLEEELEAHPPEPDTIFLRATAVSPIRTVVSGITPPMLRKPWI